MFGRQAVVDLVDDDDRGMAPRGAVAVRNRPFEPLPQPSRRRPRSTVIDLTGDDNDVPSPPRARRAPADDAAPTIDLTLDNGDGDSDLVFVAARAPPPPPPPPPPQARHGPAPGAGPLRGFDAAAVPPGNLRLFTLFGGGRYPSFLQQQQHQQLPDAVQNLRGARIMLRMPQLARPPRTRRVRLKRVARQPVGDSQCPICFEDMRESGKKGARAGRLLWCQFGCGANIHASCMDDWIKSRPNKNVPVGCVLCRTDWKGWKEEAVE